jgi:hypothetical protein
LLQVEASVYWQRDPAYPDAQEPHEAPVHPAVQEQDPLLWAVPWPLQVTASAYWHDGPAKPDAHEQVPPLWAVPLPLQVTALLYWQAVPL